MLKYLDDARIGSIRQLKEYYWEDRYLCGKSLLTPGVQTMMMYRFGVWQSGLEKGVVRWLAYRLYRFMHLFARNFYGIEISAKTIIGRRFKIVHQHGICIHEKVVIGDDCMIRQGVTIGLASNWKDGVCPPAPRIGNRVEFGAGAVVAGDITIGNDVFIGPNAVVLTDVPDGARVVSPPSRIFPAVKPNSTKN